MNYHDLQIPNIVDIIFSHENFQTYLHYPDPIVLVF